MTKYGDAPLGVPPTFETFNRLSKKVEILWKSLSKTKTSLKTINLKAVFLWANLKPRFFRKKDGIFVSEKNQSFIDFVQKSKIILKQSEFCKVRQIKQFASYIYNRNLNLIQVNQNASIV